MFNYVYIGIFTLHLTIFAIWYYQFAISYIKFQPIYNKTSHPTILANSIQNFPPIIHHREVSNMTYRNANN